ncbi:MAG: hypothetical protein CSA83_01150 [Actinomycetales bacterium]|nr:MAG: hypothetical protein CSA83_01150 [Actinomycetales bacterium]
MCDLAMDSAELLRFAEETDAIASDVAAIKVPDLASLVEQAAPGAGLSGSAATANQAIIELRDELSKGLETYSDNIRTCEANFSVTEEQVASTFNQMQPR